PWLLRGLVQCVSDKNKVLSSEPPDLVFREAQTSLAFPERVGGCYDTLTGKMEEGSVRSPVPGTGTQVIRQVEPQPADPLGPLDFLRLLPHETATSSDRLGWVGLEAARYQAASAAERNQPIITHHMLILYARPPEELDLRYEGVKRHVPPPAGAVSLVPAGSPHWVWASGRREQLFVFLKPGLVERVAAEAFGLDPARLAVPPLDGPDLPHLRAAMAALDAELTAGGAGGPLAAESLANVLAVHLIRHILTPRQPARRRAATLPRARLRAVVEYIEEHLDAGPTLEQMAAIARLSPNYFA